MIVHPLDRAVLPVIVDAEHAGAAHDADFGHGREFSLDRGDPACAVALADDRRRSASSRPPSRKSSSARMTRAPARAAVSAAIRPAGPAPITSTSQCANAFSYRRDRRPALRARDRRRGGSRLVDLLPETRRPHEGLVVEARPGRTAKASRLTAITSKASDGQRFWLAATSPSNSSTTVARVFGSRRAPSRNSTSAFGSSGPAVKMPRGR